VHGKYGNGVETLVGRQLRGNELWYEVKWQTLDDLKQNSWESMSKLKDLGVEAFALALDARMQAQAAQLDQRPLTQREIIKHLEQFGLTEEMVLNRNIGMFSAGQRSKMTLGAAMWIRPHIIALDEPTNYIDMETLDALAVALNRFRIGVVAISHSKDFIMKVCTEQWWLEEGKITVSNKIDAFEKMEAS
jgi:ATPase subunit of ABC transporter with duplicated ATPase domains